MNTFSRWAMECEGDARALVAKLEHLTKLSLVYNDKVNTALIADMATWLDEVADDLARIGGQPRDIPNYYEEVRR